MKHYDIHQAPLIKKQGGVLRFTSFSPPAFSVHNEISNNNHTEGQMANKSKAEENKMENMNEMNIKVVPQTELAGIDVTQYIGKKAKIKEFEIKEGAYGKYITFYTEAIDFMDKEKQKPLKASRMFGFQKDKNGNTCIAEGGKLHLWMKDMKVVNYKDVVGKEVIIQTTPPNKEGRKYLTF